LFKLFLLNALVVNTSPLIHLAEAGLIGMLREAALSVYVPEPVAEEIRAYGSHDPTAIALANHAWLEIRPVDSLPADILAWNLGAGETSVIALTQALSGSVAVIDDLAEGRCAEALGLPLRGKVGLVLAAKQAGRIVAARPVLERLRDKGMYLSDAVLNRALRLIGE
jgi:predicted nucleic acid-binding protein